MFPQTYKSVMTKYCWVIDILAMMAIKSKNFLIISIII